VTPVTGFVVTHAYCDSKAGSKGEFSMPGNYTRAEAWRAAIDIAEDVYRLTRTFPKEETGVLTVPLRKAAVSVLSMIAEDKGRSSNKQLRLFVGLFQEFLFEIETQINLAGHLGFVEDQQAKSFLVKTARIGQLLNGALVNGARASPSQSVLVSGDEAVAPRSAT
jgi:four helix bundle protein